VSTALDLSPILGGVARSAGVGALLRKFSVGLHPKGTTNLAKYAREASAQERSKSETAGNRRTLKKPGHKNSGEAEHDDHDET